MISHTSSISSIGNNRSFLKEKDYDLIHYFDDQSEHELELGKNKNKNKNIVKKTSLFKDNDIFSENNYSSSEDSKEGNYFNIDEDSIFDYNEKVIEVSPDGNFGKVNH